MLTSKFCTDVCTKLFFCFLFFFKRRTLRFVNEYAFIAISAKSNIHIPEVSRYHAVFKKSRLLKSTFKGPVQQPKHTAKKLIPEFFF